MIFLLGLGVQECLQRLADVVVVGVLIELNILLVHKGFFARPRAVALDLVLKRDEGFFLGLGQLNRGKAQEGGEAVAA